MDDKELKQFVEDNKQGIIIMQNLYDKSKEIKKKGETIDWAALLGLIINEVK